MAGHKHSHRSKSHRSKGNRAHEEEHIELQPRSAGERFFEHDKPKDTNFWRGGAATSTWNYVQSGTTTRFDDTPGPSTSTGDLELAVERANDMAIEHAPEGEEYTRAQQHKKTKKHDKSHHNQDRRQVAQAPRSRKKPSRGGACCFL
ncbi:hypothetical protein CIB48_g1476 [Xylaria polymorpha]|nr:hypothetical protein CIB48_g1476 [Xylaria polymorpha]